MPGTERELSLVIKALTLRQRSELIWLLSMTQLPKLFTARRLSHNAERKFLHSQRRKTPILRRRKAFSERAQYRRAGDVHDSGNAKEKLA